MEGALSPEACCSTSCTSGHKGERHVSSLLGRRLSEDSSRHRLLQEWVNMCSSMSEDASVACSERTRREEAAEPAEGHRPLVFLCSRCRRPLGDSLNWVANQEDTNCILLSCVTCNVSVNEEQMLSKRKHDSCCILQTLSCTGCSLNLGCLYRCTPKDLDYKRDMFCLSVEAIDSYVLGSSEQQVVSEDKELFNLESRVEIEKSLKEMEDVLKALQTKLWEVESKLSFTSCKS